MAIVYQHRRKDTNEVFYIGIGKTSNRAYQYGRNYLWEKVVNETEYTVEITHKDISWEEACVIEKYLISFYGRKNLNLGNLTNLTDGGDGAAFPGELNPMYGVRLPQESIERGRNKQKGRIIIHKDNKQKLIDNKDLYLYEKEGWIRGRSKQSAIKTGLSKKCIPRSEDVKNKISESLKGKQGGMKNKSYSKKICPYCNKIGGGANMTRYHFNNCKNKNNNE